MRPKRSATWRAMAAALSSEETSTATPMASKPCSAMRPARCSATARLISARATLAPALARARPKAEPMSPPPPVMMATRPSSLNMSVIVMVLPVVRSSVVKSSVVPLSAIARGDADGLGAEEFLQPFPAPFAAVATQALAAKGRFRLDLHGAVDAHGAGPQRGGQPQRATEVAGLDIGGEAVLGGIGDGEGFVFGIERGDAQHRAEDFLLGQFG